jgi:hypothetical protein
MAICLHDIKRPGGLIVLAVENVSFAIPAEEVLFSVQVRCQDCRETGRIEIGSVELGELIRDAADLQDQIAWDDEDDDEEEA